MQDRIHWQEKPLGLETKLTLTIDLSDHRSGERHPFEEMMRTLFPKGWGREDARYVARMALSAVSKAVVKDGRAAFPMEVKMMDGPRLTDLGPKLLTIDFRRATRTA